MSPGGKARGIWVVDLDDARWDQLGDLLVKYSTDVSRGQKVLIAMSEVDAFPLVQSVYRAAVQAGAFPQVQFLSEKLRHSVLRYGTEEQLRRVPELEAYGMEWADVYIGLRAASDPNEHSGIEASRLAMSQAAAGKVSALRWAKTRWCLVRLPTEALAMQAGMDLAALTDIFFEACLRDWREESQAWRRWAENLSRASRIRIIGRETDLSFDVAGRKWVVGDGSINMPDGEIMTSPDTDSVEGGIYFERPAILGGQFVHDMRLRWEKGHLVSASSSSNVSFLESVVESDAGAGLVGEFALGTNPSLSQFCNDPLLDEKILGTIHIALGRAYPECGGTNQSAIHWDIIKDMRTGGIVYADERPILQDGVWVG